MTSPPRRWPSVSEVDHSLDLNWCFPSGFIRPRDHGDASIPYILRDRRIEAERNGIVLATREVGNGVHLPVAALTYLVQQ